MLDAMASCQPWRCDLWWTEDEAGRQRDLPWHAKSFLVQVLHYNPTHCSVLTKAKSTAVFGFPLLDAIGHRPQHLMASRVIVRVFRSLTLISCELSASRCGGQYIFLFLVSYTGLAARMTRVNMNARLYRRMVPPTATCILLHWAMMKSVVYVLRVV